MTRALVTGAAGFVGRHLCRQLRENGVCVVGGVRRRGQELPEVDELCEVVLRDDPKPFLPIPQDIDVVVHLAARVHIMRDSAERPLDEFRRINTAGTANLWRSAEGVGVRRFVFVSTIKVNGEQTLERPFTHGDDPAPEDPYAISKHEAEVELQRLALCSEMELVIIRPPLVYGPGVGGNFYRMLRIAASGIPIPFGAIDNRRSIISVQNLSDVLARCVSTEGIGGMTFLVADADDVSTSELFRLIRSEMGVPSRCFNVPIKALSLVAWLSGRYAEFSRITESLQIDVTHTTEILGWHPADTVRENIAAVVRWYEQTKGPE